MAEIFISYKSERRKAAEHFSTVLKHHGYSVWFDYHLVKGQDFGLQINREIRDSKAMVVLWCSRSVNSRWVTEEVGLAIELGILIPVKIEPCALAAKFRRLDYIDLSDWDGSPRSHRLDRLIDELEQRIGRPAQIDNRGLRSYEEIWRRFGAPPLKDFALRPPIAVVEGDRQFDRSELDVEPAVLVPSQDHNEDVEVAAPQVQHEEAVKAPLSVLELRGQENEHDRLNAESTQPPSQADQKAAPPYIAVDQFGYVTPVAAARLHEGKEGKEGKEDKNRSPEPLVENPGQPGEPSAT